MLSQREILKRGDVSRATKPPRLWEDLLTGLSLTVFLTLLACDFVGAWLYETGV